MSGSGSDKATGLKADFEESPLGAGGGISPGVEGAGIGFIIVLGVNEYVPSGAFWLACQPIGLWAVPSVEPAYDEIAHVGRWRDGGGVKFWRSNARHLKPPAERFEELAQGGHHAAATANHGPHIALRGKEYDFVVFYFDANAARIWWLADLGRRGNQRHKERV